MSFFGEFNLETRPMIPRTLPINHNINMSSHSFYMHDMEQKQSVENNNKKQKSMKDNKD